MPGRPGRSASHKWRAATWVVAGSPGMLGAAHLASRAAMRAGAGMVRLSSPGVTFDPQQPVEVVGRPLGADDWAPAVLGELQRFHSVVVGPGLGRGDATANAVRHLVAGAERPVVVDGDGLAALSGHLDLVARAGGSHRAHAPRRRVQRLVRRAARTRPDRRGPRSGLPGRAPSCC